MSVLAICRICCMYFLLIVTSSMPAADEIDAIGKARGSGMDSGSQEREQGLLQLLTEMDGFKREDQVSP